MGILITGTSGFLASNFAQYWHRQHPNETIVCLDRVDPTIPIFPEQTEAEPTTSDSEKIHFIKLDLSIYSPELAAVMLEHGCDTVIHFAAEQSVNKSWKAGGEAEFIRNNVGGTRNLLDAARAVGVHKLHVINTDEVFGSHSLERPDELFDESSAYNPQNPYARSKAMQGEIVRDFMDSLHLPKVTMSYHSNNYGPRQKPEALIARSFSRRLRQQPITLYEGNQTHTREYTHVSDTCRALEIILTDPSVQHRDEYCIGSGVEISNQDIANMMLHALRDRTGEDQPADSIQLIQPERPLDDHRYTMDSSKMRSLGWEPKHTLMTGLQDTIRWYDSPEGRLFVDREQQLQTTTFEGQTRMTELR